MVRLSQLLKQYPYLPKEHSLQFLGKIALHCLKETEEENILLEGLSPNRISINDNWYSGITDVNIDGPGTQFTSYAYYPIEYLEGEEWNTACTSYAIFAITYRLMTGELPYIGKVPEELLTSKEGFNYIINKLKERKNLDIEKIHPAFQGFFEKGLAIDKNVRYQAIGDTAEEYEKLTNTFCEGHQEEETQDSLDDLNDIASDYDGFFPNSHIMNFSLDVHSEEEGGLDDLVGLSDLKDYLRSGVLSVLKNPEKAEKYKLSIPNGILLYGPPGCGKTTIAKKFAAECRMNYSVIRAQDLASTFFGGTPQLVKRMFYEAEKNAPIVIVLDECEVLFPDRNNPELIKIAENTNAFLSELCDAARRNIFFIATTNKPERIDSAVLRSGRFDKRVYVPLPDSQTRKEIFQTYLHDRPIDPNIDYQRLSDLTSCGYISSDIKQICDEVACRAFCTDSIITQDLIENVIHEGGPSVNKYELRLYEESRKFMEPASKRSQYINHIGFR